VFDRGVAITSFRTATVVAPREVVDGGEVLFIASTSFERRCLSVAERLTNDYSADVALLCEFRGDYELKPSHEESLERLYGLISLNVKSVLPCTLKTYDAVGTLLNLKTQFNELAKEHKIKQVDFDVTTFTKQYILLLLKLIDKEFPGASIRVLYTPASKYGMPGIKKALSKYVRGVVAVPGFDTFRDGSDDNWALVTFLGFDEERVLSLLDALSPKTCIPVLQARRNTHFGTLVPFESNKRLLQAVRARYSKNPIYVDAENPESSFHFLFETYKEYTKQENNILLIAPHGSKMQAVGIYLFYKAVSDPQRVGIVYALPVKYDRRQYSGDPLEYVVEFTWQSADREVPSSVVATVR